MFIGHAAVALAAKPLAPRVNLAWYLLAAYWLDVVWPVLLLARVEQVLIAPGNTAFTPLNFVHYPWTHSLAAAIVWSVGFFLVFVGKGKREALILGLLVFSHWFLDFVTHRPDLPLWPGGDMKVGLGLWNSVPATLAVESLLFAAAVWIYARRAPARDRVGTWAFWSLIAILVIAYLANAFGPPPPSVALIAYAGLAGGVLFTAWAWWADRHRGGEPRPLVPGWLWRHWPYAFAALLLAAAGGWWTVARGWPLAADAMVRRIAPETESAIGAQALAVLDQHFCGPSRLIPAMQDGLQREFATLVADAAAGHPYRLQLRNCQLLGPNAFALPGGSIVLTDQLAGLARNFQALAGALAHELGHARARHALRVLLKDASPVALARLLAGDPVAIKAWATTLPNTLLEGGYPSALEDEADSYALLRLRQLGISPRTYADLLERTEIRRANRGRESTRDYFSTHPLGTRIARVLAAETELDRCAYALGNREQRLEACTKVIDAGAGADVMSAYMLRGILLNAPGSQARAVEDLGRALSMGSRDARAYNALAWILATSTEDALRDGRRARQLALQACELSGWKDASVIDTLAAAHAENGEFGEAVRRQKEAIAFPEFAASQSRQASERLALYEAGKPHRAPPGQ